MSAFVASRPRSLLRSRLSRVGVAVAVLAACAGGWYLHLEAAPRPSHIPPPAPLPVPNAHDELVRIESLNVEPSEDILASLSPTRIAPKSAVFVTDADRQAALASAEPALNALRLALATHAYAAPPDRGAGDFDRGVMKLRSLARTLAFESRMRERAGNYAGAASSAVDILQLGLIMTKGGATLPRLVSYAVEGIGQSRLLAVIDHLDAAQATATAQRLEAVVATRTSLADSLTEEKWGDLTKITEQLSKTTTFGAYHDLHAELTSDLGDSPAEPSPEVAREIRSQNLKDGRALLTLSKQDVVDDATRMLDSSIADARLPVGAPHPPDIAVTDPIVALSILPERNRAAETMDAKCVTTDAFCLAALALRAWRVQHGAYPTSLADLTTAHILRDVPDDPFASAFRVGLRYRRLDPTHFRLYSVGPDGVDDGGRPIEAVYASGQPRYVLFDSDKGDWVFGVNGPRARANP